MTVKGGTTPACAACKYQRRRCSSECILAPYFPANQTKDFQNAHRLFGVSNIMRILKEVSTQDQREEAMKSIKFEADIRRRFPVYGCVGIIRHLQNQISQATAELHRVYAELQSLKIEQLKYRSSIPSSNTSSSLSLSPPPSNLQLGIDNSDTSLSLTQQQTQSSSCEIPFFLSIDECDDDHRFGNDASHHNHHFYNVGAQKSAVKTELPYYSLHRNDDNNNNNSINNFTAPNVYHDFQNEMPFYNAMDDRQSYIETKETCESSSESSSREFQRSIKHASEIELRNAAASFTLKHIK